MSFIFCGGMYRSGSTLQYNIASEIIERLGVGSREKYYPIHEIYFKNKLNKDLKTFKSHLLSKEIEEQIRNNNAYVLLTYRDIRDVMASWQKKNNFIFEVADGLKWARSTINSFEKWENLSCKRKLISKYEIFTLDIKQEVNSISEFIGFDIDKKTIDEVADNVMVEKFKKRLENLSIDQLEVDNNLSWDQKTLIHLDHFQDGRIGKYKKELSKELQELTTKEFNSWLVDHGYEY